ncbi:MAG: hypothetical protein KA436_10190 [Oligoflexales bacterium]|nr:hypothetical protein [Oligoflexales bacterium]
MQKSAEWIQVYYEVQGPISKLKIVEPNPDPFYREGIWESTCCELFISIPPSQGYKEWNISPSGDWFSMHFSGYRTRQANYKDLSPPLSTNWRREGDKLSCSLKVKIPVSQEPLHLSICTILEDLQGEKSYWSLTHTQPNPDFHDLGSFSLFWS